MRTPGHTASTRHQRNNNKAQRFVKSEHVLNNITFWPQLPVISTGPAKAVTTVTNFNHCKSDQAQMSIATSRSAVLLPTTVGHLGAILSPLGAILKPSWGPLGALLGRSWGHLGASWGHLWSILGFGPILDRVGRF